MLPTKTFFKSNPLSLNSIFHKVHHPPPLDKRESQRLLNALTVSFRNHLDKEHGSLTQPSPVGTPYTLNKSPTSPSPSPASATNDAYQRPTERHVLAILSNPLFSYEPAKTLAPSPRAKRDPMDVFDQAVAKGIMTVQRATGVLIAKRQAVAQSSSTTINGGIATSGTAHRVVSWLRSSGLERHLAFVEHRSFLEQLIPYMLEEGLEDTVWLWVDRWLQQPYHAHANHHSPLLNALVRAKVPTGTSLDAGYTTMLRAGDLFSNNNAFPSLALGPWKSLSMLSTVFAWQRPPPSETLFDSFAAMGQPFDVRFNVQVDRAHLDLHHPTHPDAAAAMAYLESPLFDRLKQLLSDPGHLTRQDEPNKAYLNSSLSSRRVDAKRDAKHVVLMATDAASYLTRTGDNTKAEWIRDLLTDKLSYFLRKEMAATPADLSLWPGALSLWPTEPATD